LLLAIDTSAGAVFSHGGRHRTERLAAQWALEAAERGAGEILLTSIDHDGRREGFDVRTTGDLRESLSIPVIASGGAGTVQHVAEALAITDAALIASIVHENPQGLPALRAELRRAGVALRPDQGDNE
jgi:cyclase